MRKRKQHDMLKVMNSSQFIQINNFLPKGCVCLLVCFHQVSSQHSNLYWGENIMLKISKCLLSERYSSNSFWGRPYPCQATQ